MISELFSGNAFLWTCVWQSTVCVVLGLVGSFVFRHWPARAHRILFVAIIAAVIVPILSSLVRYYELGIFVAEPAVIHSEVEDLYRVNNYEALEIMPAEDFEYTLSITEEYSAPATVAQSEGVNIPWGQVALWVWIAASLFLTVRLLVTFLLGVRLLSQALPLGCEKIRDAVHVARAKLGFGRNVEVYSSAGVCSPVIWCWGRRPVLLVPSGSGRVDNRVNWISVLCHELAHWKRRDHISGLLAELMVCVFPWNPLMWWAKRRLVSLSEQACDDWVLASGQVDTNYAQSLLDLSPQGQMAFVPAVVGSKKVLGARIRRILKEGCGNPRTGTLWALVVGIVAMSVAVGIAFAQTRQARTEDDAGQRVLHFPKNRSLGRLMIQDAGIVRHIDTFYHWVNSANWYENAEYLGEARGDITVPADKRVALFVNRNAVDNLSGLLKLKPNDLYMLSLASLLAKDKCMIYISHLTGLKELDLQNSGISSVGLKDITKLQSLERLTLPRETGNSGLSYVAELKFLRGLYFQGEERATNAGLRHLSKLASLEELAVGGTHIDNAGMVHLSNLESLKYLFLLGKISDDGLVHIKKLPHLKILNISHPWITDVGLEHLSELRELENLNLNNTRITDDGLAHLRSMKSLKKLNLGGGMKITDEGMAHLSEIKSLKYLDLPGESVTDKGLVYLSQLTKLKHLNMPSPHYVDPGMDKRLYTDKGLEELTKLQSLEELYLSGLAVTDEGMNHVAKLSNLKELHLFGCPITDKGLGKLTALKSLRRLTLYESKVTISGLAQLNSLPDLILLDATDIRQDNSILNISGLTKLECLTIGTQHKGGVIRDEDLACLANLNRLKWFQISSAIIKPMAISDEGMAHLEGLTNIERLTIGGPNLTDDGLRYFANMKKLDLLNIIGGKFTDKGLRHLEGLKSLRNLSIDAENDFSPAALQRLRKNLPNMATLMVNEKNGGMGGIGGGIESDGGQRVLHFPNDHSIGMLKIQDAETVGRIKDFYNMGKPDWWFPGWEFLGEAKGDVVIPAGKVAALRISEPQQWRDLSGLSRLNKDDLYFLCIEGSKNDGPRPGDACMKHIALLTGLKGLEILYPNMTARGIQPIKGLTSLETLVVAGNFDDAGLAVVSKIPHLKHFYIWHFSYVTDAGMRHIGELKQLEELVICGDMVDGEGLRHLSKLPRLRYLHLFGKKFTDNGMVHLSKIPNLKTLQVAWLYQLTDKALMHIAECDKLETVSFHDNENITDKGLENLSTIKSLKSLYVHNSQITDEGVKHLSKIKSLEHLHLPYRNIGDRGLVYLSNLSNLRQLGISRDYIIDPEMDKGYYTDEGVKVLSKLSQLEELNIGSRGMSDKSMDYISSLTKLKVLRLGQGNTVTDKGIAKLRALTSLEELGINYANMTISGLSALNNLSNLKQLDVEGMKQDGSVLDISGMTKLERLTLKTRYEEPSVICDEDLACLVNLKDLKQLYIRCAEQPMKPMVITDKGMAHLEGLTKMEDLGIGGILTDEGLKSLRNMKNMWRLSIYGGRFTDKGLRHLEGFRKLRMLTIIEAEANFSPQALQRLREKMPILHTLEIGDMDQLYGGMGGGMMGGMGSGQSREIKATEANATTEVEATEDFQATGRGIGGGIGGGMGGMGGGIESDTGQRILHFPKDRSLGELKIRDADTIGRVKDFYNKGKPDWWFPDWEHLGQAKGDVTVPAGKLVALRVSKPEQWRNLSPLGELDKDDLYLLNIEGSYYGGPKPRDACMKHITRLTGLKRLEIMYTDITARGIQQIEKLKSLETLVIAGKLDDAGLAVISKLPSLKYLYIQHQSQITNAGMRHLDRLKGLEELVISGDMVGDEGLVHLSKLPRLRYLKLHGQRFTDEGMIHLRKIPNLKSLQVYRLTQLTDKALMHISACDNLETVSFHFNENITDKGAEYLSTMKSLKRLDINKAQMTGEGLKYLSQIKSLEHLDLPSQILGDRELAYLSSLGNLRDLRLDRTHFIDPEMDKGFYTDKGVKELSKLRRLEKLSLGSRGLTDEGMDYVCQFTNLKGLSLFGCINVTDNGLAKLGNLKSLESLSINSANITISGLSALNNLSNLKHLDVVGLEQDGSVLDISGMTKLENLTIGTHDKGGVIRDEDLACLANLRDLKRIEISSAILPLKPMAISDKGIAHLEGLTNIVEIAIGGPNLTDEGLKSLRNMKNMEQLGIYGGRFTDKGLRHLEGLTKLSSLTIDADNNFSSQALQRLREKLPNLVSLNTDNKYWGIGGGTAGGMGGYAGKN